MYKVLEKIPGGIQVRGRTLPQVLHKVFVETVLLLRLHVVPFIPCSSSPLTSNPQRTTVISTSGHEKKFAILVEELFSDITCPEYRQLVVEVSVAAIRVI